MNTSNKTKISSIINESMKNGVVLEEDFFRKLLKKDTTESFLDENNAFFDGGNNELFSALYLPEQGAQISEIANNTEAALTLVDKIIESVGKNITLIENGQIDLNDPKIKKQINSFSKYVDVGGKALSSYNALNTLYAFNNDAKSFKQEITISSANLKMDTFRKFLVNGLNLAAIGSNTIFATVIVPSLILTSYAIETSDINFLNTTHLESIEHLNDLANNNDEMDQYFNAVNGLMAKILEETNKNSSFFSPEFLNYVNGFDIEIIEREHKKQIDIFAKNQETVKNLSVIAKKALEEQKAIKDIIEENESRTEKGEDILPIPEETFDPLMPNKLISMVDTIMMNNIFEGGHSLLKGDNSLIPDEILSEFGVCYFESEIKNSLIDKDFFNPQNLKEYSTNLLGYNQVEDAEWYAYSKKQSKLESDMLHNIFNTNKQSIIDFISGNIDDFSDIFVDWPFMFDNSFSFGDYEELIIDKVKDSFLLYFDKESNERKVDVVIDIVKNEANEYVEKDFLFQKDSSSSNFNINYFKYLDDFNKEIKNTINLEDIILEFEKNDNEYILDPANKAYVLNKIDEKVSKSNDFSLEWQKMENAILEKLKEQVLEKDISTDDVIYQDFNNVYYNDTFNKIDEVLRERSINYKNEIINDLLEVKDSLFNIFEMLLKGELNEDIIYLEGLEDLRIGEEKKTLLEINNMSLWDEIYNMTDSFIVDIENVFKKHNNISDKKTFFDFVNGDFQNEITNIINQNGLDEFSGLIDMYNDFFITASREISSKYLSKINEKLEKASEAKIQNNEYWEFTDTEIYKNFKMVKIGEDENGEDIFEKRYLKTIQGDSGDNKISGFHQSGNNIYGGEGNDAIYASKSGNYLSGGSGDDYISGYYEGIDTIDGGDGNDMIFADGNQSLYDSNSKNTIYGGSGNDTIYGGTSFNTIYGGDGNDIINTAREKYNEGGFNDITGGKGNDDIYLNNGSSSNIFFNIGDGNDRIFNFSRGESLNIIFGNNINEEDIRIDNLNNSLIIRLGNENIFIEDFFKNNTLKLSFVFSNNNSYTFDDYLIRNEEEIPEIIDGTTENDTVELSDLENHTINTSFGEDLIMLNNINNTDINSESDNDVINILDVNFSNIDSGSGNDDLYIYNGQNLNINTQNGNDELTIDNIEYSNVNSGNDNDKIFISKVNNTNVDLGFGDDTVDVKGEGLNNTVNGKEGNDVINVSNQINSNIIGGKGDDFINLEGSKNTTVNSGDDNDVISTERSENVTIYSGQGDDYILSKNSEDINIYIDDGDNIIDFEESIDSTLFIDSNSGNNIIDFDKKSNNLNIVFNRSLSSFKYVKNNSNLDIIDSNGNVTQITEYFNKWNEELSKHNISFGSTKYNLLNFLDVILSEINTGNDSNNVIEGLYDKVNIINSKDGSDNIRGGNLNDIINGGEGHNTIQSKDGDDIITVSNGHNIIDSGYGNDHITVGDGHNTIDVSGGNNYLKTGDGTNVINLGDGDNILDLGNGDNYIKGLYENSSQNIKSGNGNNDIELSKGTHNIDLGNGNNYLKINAGNHKIKTGNGNNHIITYQGKSIIETGDGNDQIVANFTSSEIYSGGGDDYISLSYISNYNGIPIVNSGEGNDTIEMFYGSAKIIGGKGDDNLLGNSDYNDIYYNIGDGDDTIENSRFRSNLHFNNISINDVSFDLSNNDLSIILFKGQVNEGSVSIKGWLNVNNDLNGYKNGTFKFSDIELNSKEIADKAFKDFKVKKDGTAEDDHMIGDKNYGNLINGKLGDDYIEGGKSYDTIYGGSGNDTIYGGSGEDVLNGNSGNDIIYSGNPWVKQEGGYFSKKPDYDVDIINGGSGDDIINTEINDVVIFESKLDVNAGHDVVYGENNIDVQLHINDSSKIFYIKEQNNLIIEIKQNNGREDSIQLSNWFSNIDSNNDVAIIRDSNSPVYISPSFIKNNLVIDGIGEIKGSNGNDTLNGYEDLHNEIHGSTGDDTISGGQKNDTIYGEEGNDVIFGNSGNDNIEGGTGEDIIYGGSGDDYIMSGSGNDTILGDSGNDTINAGSGDNIITTGSDKDTIIFEMTPWSILGNNIINDVLGDNIEITMNFETANIQYEKEESDLIIKIEDGDNIGTVKLINWFNEENPQRPNELKIKDSNRNEADKSITVEEIHGIIGYDPNQTDGTIVINGSENSDFVEGSEANEEIHLGSGNDFVNAMDGDDIIHAGAGEDYIITGAGNDTVYYNIHSSGFDNENKINDSKGDNIVVNFDAQNTAISYSVVGVDLVMTLTREPQTGSIVFERWFDGTDPQRPNEIKFVDVDGDMSETFVTVEDINAIVADEIPEVQSGTAEEDTISGVNDKVNILNGLSGADTISGGNLEDRIHGGEGDDSLSGLSGEDAIYGESGEDIINGGSGNDNLFGGSENDVISGGLDSDSLYGESGNDIVNGDEGDDSIYGGEGDDTIYGGTGNDNLFGGSGNDILDTGDGFDTIYFELNDWETIGDDIVKNITSNDAIRIHLDTSTSDISYSKSDLDMIISIQQAGESHSITIENWFDENNPKRPNDIIIMDNVNWTQTTYSAADIHNQVLLSLMTNITGTESDDVIEGTNSYDRIEAGAGNDVINSGDEIDIIIGGEGDDTIDSGLGSDTIIYSYSEDNSDGNDTIINSNGDRLEIHANAQNFSYQISRSGRDFVLNILTADSEVGGSLLFKDWLSEENQQRLSEIVIVDTEGVFSKNSLDLSNITERLLETLIDGTENDDVIVGTYENDEIQGKGGDDNINSQSGDDIIYGGAGDDIISSDGGNNIVYGEGGNDTITTGWGDDTIYGGNENDTINAGSGNNVVNGNAGNDVIETSSDDDTIYGGEGDDIISSEGGHNHIEGGSGSDNITTGWGQDTVYGGEGNDTIIDEGNSADTIYGGSGNDTITTSYGDNHIEAGEGDDIVNGGFGNDTIYGGEGDDTINSSQGNDTIYGGDGNDIITTTWGDDTIYGGKGDDTINANTNSKKVINYNLGDGNDILNIAMYGKSTEDEIVFGEGISVNDLSFDTNIDNDLIITINEGLENEGSLTIKDWFNYQYAENGYTIGKFVFSDNTELSYQELGEMATEEVEMKQSGIQQFSLLSQEMASFGTGVEDVSDFPVYTFAPETTIND